VAEGSISTFEDVAVTIAAAYRGHAIVARLDAASPTLRAVLLDSFGRLGQVELRERGRTPMPRLTTLQRRMLDDLARGATIADLAAEEGLSRRTVELRLAQARASLGAHTTAEAVARHRC
jgi:DNA-binding NarL/FixJ family response regulator